MGEAERHLNPERVRNIFLGLNDGQDEILGAWHFSPAWR